MKFLLACSQGPLEEYRLPELQSIAKLFSFTLTYDEPIPDISRPYMIVHMDSEREARLLGSRVIFVKSIWAYWGDAETYDELHDLMRGRSQLWEPYRETTRWKFNVSTYGRNMLLKEQVAVIETFEYMALLGDIDLKNPETVFGVMEEFPPNGMAVIKDPKDRVKQKMRWVWMGRLICKTQRHLIEDFNLKKRSYIGTTSMDAEVSLLMANQALASPGKIIYDPFAGTGSMLLTCAKFGAMAFGSDIDGRQLRGRDASTDDNAVQYGLAERLLDNAIFDVTQHPFRCGELFDAIITDPPYGVRAGAKKLGLKDGERVFVPKFMPGFEDQGWSYTLPDYIPPSRPWEMSSVIETLITFSLYMLKPGGRLVFFLPTDNAEYADVDIPTHPSLVLISNSKQDFGKWARRLITMEKIGATTDDVLKLDRGVGREVGVEKGMEGLELEEKKGHSDFRTRYFEGFVSRVATPEVGQEGKGESVV